MEKYYIMEEAITNIFKNLLLPDKTSYLVAQYDKQKWEVISEYQGETIHASASMIKVLILYALVLSSVDLCMSIKVKEQDKVQGGGALQEFSEEIEITVRSLANLMITLSDNTATNKLIDLLGMEYVNTVARDLGLKNTILQRKMMDFQAAQNGRENLMSVHDYCKLLQKLYSLKSMERFNWAWNVLARQQFRDCLPGFWSEEQIFHHKTGELDGVVHDGGIFEKNNKTIILVCFSSKGINNYATKIEMAKFGQSVFELL